MISQRSIDKVRESANLLELFSEITTVVRRGSSNVSLCPFHKEKTPSCSIDCSKGLFYCFGCGESGNVFDFIMKIRSLTFPEAVHFLADKYSIALEFELGRTKPDPKREQWRKKREKLLTLLSSFYHDCLMKTTEGELGLDYWRKRELPNSLLREFEIGFAPANSIVISKSLNLFTDKLSCSESELLEMLNSLGLVFNAAEKRDMFRNRLIFPIRNARGIVRGMGGRIIEKNTKAPKYINSRESDIYQKKKELFGLYRALPEIKKHREVYVVEGYIDVLRMVGCSYSNVIAVCGTALSSDHVRILSRAAKRLTLLFDGDDAGFTAASLAFPSILNSGLDAEVILLPPGEDPDSLLKGGSKSIFTELKSTAMPIIDVFLQRLIKEEGGEEPGPGSLGKIAGLIALELRKVNNPVERDFLIKRSAEVLGTEESSITSLVYGVKRIRRSGFVSKVPRSQVPPGGNTLGNFHGRELLICFLRKPNITEKLCKKISAMNLSEGFGHSFKHFLDGVDHVEILNRSTLEEIGNESGFNVSILAGEADRRDFLSPISDGELLAECDSLLEYVQSQIREISLKKMALNAGTDEEKLRLLQERLELKRNYIAFQGDGD